MVRHGVEREIGALGRGFGLGLGRAAWWVHIVSSAVFHEVDDPARGLVWHVIGVLGSLQDKDPRSLVTHI